MLREPELNKNRKRAEYAPVRILLVEDDPLFADLLQTQLRRLSWAESRLEIAATLAEAREKLAVESFGLVLADLNLPDSSGLQTVEALARSGEQLVIVLTGSEDAKLRAGALEAGAHDFVSKDQLSATVLERLVRLAAIQANTFRSLRESEARFRSLVELSSDWYWEQDEELRFTRFEGRSGGRAELAIGRRRWEIPGLAPLSGSWQEHRATLEARRPFRDFEYGRQGTDGGPGYVSVSGEPVYDARGRFCGYRGLASDITVRKRDDERLRRFRLAMDTSADMILLIDRASMRHIDVNATACRLLGYSREELLAMGPADILPLGGAELEALYDAMIAAPDAVSGMRSHYRCKDGSRLPFESTRRVMRSGSDWIIAVISRDLRDRIASEKALGESEARKAAILDAASDGVVTMAHDGRIVEFNAAAESMFGFSHAEAVGRDMAELIIPPEQREAHRSGLARLIASGEPRILGKRIEVAALRADGSRFDAELVIVRIPGSEPPLFTGTARDISARKYEERLLALEHAVTHVLAAAENAAAGIEAVMRAICEAQRWKAGRFYRLDEAAGVMRFELGVTIAGRQLLEGARALEFAKGIGLPGLVWQTGEALWISDTATDPRVARRDVAREIGQHSALLFPVRAEGGIVGVISIASDVIREPDERLRRTMQLIGSQIGQFLGRKRAEEELRRFRLAMDSSADMIVIIDRASMRFADVNRTVCTLLGYSREEMLALGPQDVLPVTRAQLEASYDALIADPGGSASRMNSYYRCKDGSRLPFESTRQVLRSGERWLVAAISRDIRERIASEQALRSSEARFRSLTGLSSDMYWEQDTDYRFTVVSGTSPRWLEAGRARMIGRRRWDQRYFNMTDADWAAHQAALDARLPFHDLELGRLNEAGERVWVSVSGEPVFDDTEAFTGYRGVGRDITGRKREEALRALEHGTTRCLAEADSAAGGLQAVIRLMCESQGWECGRYFAVDEDAGVLRFVEAWGAPGPAIEEFLRNSRAKVYRAGEGLSGTVWQSGEPLWVSDVSKDARSSGSSRTANGTLQGGSFVFPVRAEGRTVGVLSFSSGGVRTPDGRLLEAVQVIGSQVGQFLARKRTEIAVRESEARFRSLTNLSSDWYWEQDAQFRFTKFEGKGHGEGRYAPAAAVLGRRLWQLGGIELGSFDLERYQAQLARHESFRQLEYSYRDRAGRRFYVSADGEPFFDERGEFAGYRGTSRDVTEQRRGEEELRRFRAAMDMSWDAIYLTDRATMRFVDVNQAACRGVGYSREQLLGMGPHDLLLMPKAEMERGFDALIADPGRTASSERTYVGRDGEMRWTEIHSRALRAGESWIIVTISRDVTERKLAEQRQAAHLHYQEKLSRFGQSALGRRQPAELVDEAVQTVLESLAAEAVAYLERGPGEREVVQRSLVGLAAGGEAASAALAEGNPILQAFASGARVAAPGAQLQLPWAAGLEGAVIPVRGESRTRGALCVCTAPAEPFSAEALNFMEAIASVLSTGLQRIESEGRLAYLAQFDPLTGLPNRALLADRFSQMIVQARRHARPLAVLFIDLDEFKLVNDTLGHAGGDELLKEVAVRLQSAVRSGDTVARISGDEFAVVLADLARAEDAAVVAQKVIERLAAPVDVLGQEVFVTASVGIAGFPGDGADAEALIGAADAAMYRAKQSGRNAFQFFTAEINQRSRARAQLGAELRRALEREEFALVYQPKFRLADRGAGGAEALLRWKHPERGTVSPAEFIPVLEETGLIVPVGEWVLRRACEDLKAWRAGGLDAGPVAVNLSARQFRLPDLDARLKAVVADAGVDPALIELEITESQLMQDPDHAIRVMRSLRDAGMRIAIDDFGTGYSSLAYLTRFPVGSLKIDRSFVASVNDDPSAAAIVRTIIEMAHTLGFTVVAEGVETEAQAEYLRRHGCEQGQGYLFARPMPAAELAALLAKHCG